ncbi:MAG: glycosyltransferase [Acidobacteriaceae bacterium]|nr:glycosyltransferase [Acidobacteriaceae bacterium]
MTGDAEFNGSCQVCIIFPCYNEATRLNVPLFRTFLADSRDSRIVFVDDGSNDKTVEVLEELCRGYENRAGVLRCGRNRGKAEAVRFGICHALEQFQPEIIGYWDADLATPLDSVRSFVNVLEERPTIEMVFGSRVKLLGRHVERRAIRHYLGRIFATVVSVVLRLPIYDTQCGAKLFRVTPHVTRVFAEPFLSKWVFDVEILARYLSLYRGDSRQLEEVIYEYPLERWVDVAGSKVGPKDFVTAFVDIVRIQRRYLSRF